MVIKENRDDKTVLCEWLKFVTLKKTLDQTQSSVSKNDVTCLRQIC